MRQLAGNMTMHGKTENVIVRDFQEKMETDLSGKAIESIKHKLKDGIYEITPVRACLEITEKTIEGEYPGEYETEYYRHYEVNGKRIPESEADKIHGLEVAFYTGRYWKDGYYDWKWDVETSSDFQEKIIEKMTEWERNNEKDGSDSEIDLQKMII